MTQAQGPFEHASSVWACWHALDAFLLLARDLSSRKFSLPACKLLDSIHKGFEHKIPINRCLSISDRSCGGRNQSLNWVAYVPRPLFGELPASCDSHTFTASLRSHLLSFKHSLATSRRGLRLLHDCRRLSSNKYPKPYGRCWANRKKFPGTHNCCSHRTPVYIPSKCGCAKPVLGGTLLLSLALLALLT